MFVFFIMCLKFVWRYILIILTAPITIKARHRGLIHFR